MILTMEYSVQPVNPYSPYPSTGYFDTFVQNIQWTHDPNQWASALVDLRNEEGYLEALLSKTATTLNALRERQSRNERALSTNPTPRSKKKKIQQNRWRTDKTIKTCEYEERIILGCLQVCRNNLSILESIIHPTDMFLTAADCYSSTCQSYVNTVSMPTNSDWGGWANSSGLSPFQRTPQHPRILDEIPPEACWQEIWLGGLVMNARKPVPLSPGSHSLQAAATLPPPPPNLALMQINSVLSPQAACFEPSVTHAEVSESSAKEPDMLSIQGLLALKRVQTIQLERMRRSSDAAHTGHMFRHLSGNAHSQHGLIHTQHCLNHGCVPETRRSTVDYSATFPPLYRAQSI